MATYRDLLKYAATGQASPSMTYYDRMRASTLMGGVVKTLTGQPPLTFKADGSPLISWSMKGNGSQTGTPTPDNPVMPTFCGVRTGNLFEGAFGGSIGTTGGITYSDQYKVYYARVTAGATYTISGGYYVYAYYSDIPAVGTVNSVDNERHFTSQGSTITVIEGATWIGVRVNSGDKPMINLGSTALPYEPYGWAEKITCGGQTVPVYLGQTQTVRRIKKLVLDGTNNFTSVAVTGGLAFVYNPALYPPNKWNTADNVISSHYKPEYNNNNGDIYFTTSRLIIVDFRFETVDAFKTYLASEYAAGHPVTVWYALATPETGIANEPLCKIGTYADELSSEDASVTIPTIKGQNVLTVDTPIQPSEMTITYKG